MTHEELTNFDMRAGAEKRHKMRGFIRQSDKASYVLILINNDKVFYYIGNDYFADQFSGIYGIKIEWDCYKKHFLEGSYLRNFIENTIKNENEWHYILNFPVYSYSQSPVYITEDYVKSLLDKYNIKYKKLTKLSYTQEIQFDPRNSEM